MSSNYFQLFHCANNNNNKNSLLLRKTKKANISIRSLYQEKLLLETGRTLQDSA